MSHSEVAFSLPSRLKQTSTAPEEGSSDLKAFPPPAFSKNRVSLVPERLPEALARRLRAKHIVGAVAEAGVLPPGCLTQDLDGFIDPAAATGTSSMTVHGIAEGGGSAVGVLPKMLGLIPEGNLEMASTYAWEDDIIWGDQDDDDTRTRGLGSSAQSRSGVPPRPALEPLGKCLPPARLPGLHPLTMRLEGIPSVSAGEGAPEPIIVSRLHQAATAGGTESAAAAALRDGVTAGLTSKLRLQLGLASMDWLEEILWDGEEDVLRLERRRQAAGRRGGQGAGEGAAPTPMISAAAAVFGRLADANRMRSLSLCAPGPAPLLLDLNDPGMVFVSQKASALRHAGAMVRAAPHRIKPVSGPPMVPDDEVCWRGTYALCS